jgi:hypothetical protein
MHLDLNADRHNVCHWVQQIHNCYSHISCSMYNIYKDLITIDVEGRTINLKAFIVEIKTWCYGNLYFTLT